MSTQRLRRPALALVAAIAVALGALACASSGVNQGDFNVVSLEEEWQLGQQLEADIGRQLQVVGDRSANRYVTQLGRKLVAQTEMANLPWEFHIVADGEINAFNIPGGHVYLNTGLITAARDASELAGVMAHEISHGVARHGTEQLTKAYGLNILAGLALGQNPAVYEQILAQVIGGGTLAKFSRDAEREADMLGIRTMYGAGYDPIGMASMFEVLLQNRQRRPSSVEQFFASHPLTEERIQDVRAAAAELPPKRGLTRQENGFRSLQNAVSRYN